MVLVCMVVIVCILRIHLPTVPRISADRTGRLTVVPVSGSRLLLLVLVLSRPSSFSPSSPGPPPPPLSHLIIIIIIIIIIMYMHPLQPPRAVTQHLNSPLHPRTYLSLYRPRRPNVGKDFLCFRPSGLLLLPSFKRAPYSINFRAPKSLHIVVIHLFLIPLTIRLVISRHSLRCSRRSSISNKSMSYS